MAWTFTDVTAAADLSAFVDAPSLVVTQRAYADVSRLSATIRDELATIADPIDHEVLLTDGAQKVFAGIVRVRAKSDTGVAGQRIYRIECQDFTTLLGDDYAPAGSVRSTTESDKARITWLFATFGTKGVAIGASVQTLRATMPAAQDFSGKTLHECLTMIAAVTGGSFYVDYDKVLHYFTSEVNAAPFGLSDAPNGSTTFGFEDFAEASDTVDFVNEVHVIYAGGSTTRYLGGSPPAAGTRRAMVLNDAEIPDLATAQARGDSIIATYGVTKKPSTLKTYKAGLKAGQYVQVTHSGWGIAAATYRIAGLQARPETKDRIGYLVDFGSGAVELGSLLSGALGNVATANAVAQQAAQGIAQIADLSVGGANLVPNSSFEDGSAWSVGSSWTIGFTPSGGQLPFQGADTARLVLAGGTAGVLVTPKIAVDRNDEYVASFWHFVRSRSSGALRAIVREYNAANALLASTTFSLTAVDTAWTRELFRFAPAAHISPPKTAWQPTTASVEIAFDSGGAAATLTADIDGVQLERGEAPTAYAPSPGEILAGSIGTTQIADDAITTAKVIAGAIVAAKIAAGTITGDRIAAGTITTNLLAAGAITLYDEFGSSVLTPSGFEGAWADFMGLGTYNGRFRQGNAGTVGLGRTSNLPFWTVANDVGTPTLTHLNPGLRFTFGAVNQVKRITSDAVAVIPGLPVEFGVVIVNVTTVAGTGLTGEYWLEWFDASLATISSSTHATFTYTGGSGVSSPFAATDHATPPATAAFAKLHFTAKEITAHSASVKVELAGGIVRPSPDAVGTLFADNLSASVLLQSTGRLQVLGRAALGNVAAGIETLTPVANTPTSVAVTGLSIDDNAGADTLVCLVTPHTSVPGSQVQGVGHSSLSTSGVTLWIYRTNNTPTTLSWLIATSGL